MLEQEEVFLLDHGLIFKYILIVFLVCTFLLQAKQVSRDVQEQVEPYLLPDDHPIKPLLDAIFSQTRATLSLDSLEEAGFNKSKPRKFTNIIVTKHPSVPGFVFKMSLDSQRYHKNNPEYHYWILRIQGVQLVADIITSFGLEDQFKCPRKWMYALPKYPKAPEGYLSKSYILVEEDMELLDSEVNENLWSSDKITPNLLDNLFFILQEVGLSDCAKPANIPFSKDGRISFIDTQSHGSDEVRYKKLLPFLSDSNQKYWKTLIKQNQPWNLSR